MHIFKLAIIGIWFVFTCCFGLFLYLFKWTGLLDLNYIMTRMLAKVILGLNGVKVLLKNRENMIAKRPCIYIANHQSMLDAITMGSICPKGTIAIGKKEILRIPFFGLLYAAAGNVLLNRGNNRKAVHSLSQAVEAIKKRGVSIWIFPEGTRNKSGNVPLLPFKKGAFHLAIDAGVPIVPVVSSPIREVFDGLRFTPGKIVIKALPPIETTAMTAADVRKLSDRTAEVMKEAILGLSRSHP